MKGRLLALLVSVVVHISLFALIIYLYDLKKTVVTETKPIKPLKVALVNPTKKTPIPNKKQTTTPPMIYPLKAAQKTNKKYAKKPQTALKKTVTTSSHTPNKKASIPSSSQITQAKKKTDPELDKMIRAYQQSLQTTSHKTDERSQQRPQTQNNIAKQPTTKKTTPNVLSLLPEKVDYEAEQRYKAHLRTLISKKKHYPKRAKRTQKEGTIILSFIIYADGKIENINLKKHSGYKILDQAAIKSIQQLSGSLPFPTTIKRKQWSFTLPIVYRLH